MTQSHVLASEGRQRYSVYTKIPFQKYRKKKLFFSETIFTILQLSQSTLKINNNCENHDYCNNHYFVYCKAELERQIGKGREGEAVGETQEEREIQSERDGEKVEEGENANTS